MSKTILDESILADGDFPALAGITKNKAGDFSITQEKGAELLLNQLLTKELTGNLAYRKLVAQHGAEIHDVNECKEWQNGDGLFSFRPDFENKKTCGPVLISLTADCPTICFSTLDQRFIAIAHSGWRGTEKKIVPNMLSVIKKLGIDYAKVRAVIFPGICGDCYQVEEDVGKKFFHFKNGYLNLRLEIFKQLNTCLDALSISTVSYCSYHSKGLDGHGLFSSFRLNGTSFRNAVFIARKV
jgi:copper oxidase (laccase) domain-containing protein